MQAEAAKLRLEVDEERRRADDAAAAAAAEQHQALQAAQALGHEEDAIVNPHCQLAEVQQAQRQEAAAEVARQQRADDEQVLPEEPAAAAGPARSAAQPAPSLACLSDAVAVGGLPGASKLRQMLLTASKKRQAMHSALSGIFKDNDPEPAADRNLGGKRQWLTVTLPGCGLSLQFAGWWADWQWAQRGYVTSVSVDSLAAVERDRDACAAWERMVVRLTSACAGERSGLLREGSTIECSVLS